MFVGFPKKGFFRKSFPTRKIGNTGSTSERFSNAFAITAGITLDVEREALYYLVTSLIAADLWDKMVAIYPMVGSTAFSCSLNLKNPSLHQITWVNAPTFSNTGVQGNGVNQYGNINLNPSTALTYNSIHLSFYSRTSGSVGNQCAMGGYNVSSLIGTALYTAGSGIFSSGRSPFFGAHPTFAVLPSTAGFFLGTKDTGNAEVTYFNGGLKNTVVNTASTPFTSSIFLLAANNGPADYSTQECAFASLGALLTAQQISDYYTIVQEFQTILSRQV